MATRSFGTEISGNRRRSAELSPEQRSAIVYARQMRVSIAKLAEEFQRSNSTITRTVQRFEARADLKSHPRSGRPTKFTPSIRRRIFRLARKNPWWSYRVLRANTDGNPSRDTIRRILKTYQLHERRSRKRIPLTKQTARKRLQFTRNWRDLAEGNSLEDIIFSDECSVMRRSTNGER